MSSSRLRALVSWALRLLAAGILFQTLFFKFTASAESVHIFTTLGMEPWGRIGSGVTELVACVLLLLPRGVVLGALLSVGVMAGALASHLTLLGVEVLGDGGLLFGLAVVVLLAGLALLWLHRAAIPLIGRRLAPRRHAHGAGARGSCRIGRSAGRRVVILGGGFGGVYAALELEKRLRDDDDVEVLLVNRDNFFLFTPMLHEVAASDLDVTHIVNPVRALLRRVDFFQGDVERVDLEARRVTLRHGTDSHVHAVDYDVLVVALGSTTNFFGTPGLAERALTMKTLGDAVHLRNRMIAALEEADTECAAARREDLLTFVVAGGGFAGVETVAGMNDFLRDALPYYPHLTEEDLRVVLVHSGDVILPELGTQLGAYAQTKLRTRGVEMRIKSRVAGLSDDGVRLNDGTTIPTRVLVWTAGTSAHPLLATLPCKKDKGRICVDEHLELQGFPGVFALGDCAVVPDVRTGGFHPPTAQHALREGAVAAHNVLAFVRGTSRRRFEFTTLGQLAAIGRRTGVARMFGVNFSGFVAWWLWRSIYLSKLPRFEKKLRVALDWTLDVFFAKDLVQVSTERSSATATQTPGESRTQVHAAG